MVEWPSILCMLFACDIVLIDKTKEGKNDKCNFSTNKMTRDTIKLLKKEIALSGCFKRSEFIF